MPDQPEAVNRFTGSVAGSLSAASPGWAGIGASAKTTKRTAKVARLALPRHHSPLRSPVSQRLMTFQTNSKVKVEAAPLLGQHTGEVLSELLGYSETTIAHLKERRVI